MLLDFKTYFLLFVIYSFLGWIVEMIDGVVERNEVVNRGFLIGPYCPIYGFGTIAILILLKDYAEHPVALFISAIFICSILEYFTSFFMEKIFKVRWWDYSNKKFNLNGRICLETMIPFGLAASFVWYVVNPILLKFLGLFSESTLIIVSFILAIILFIDMVTSLWVAGQYKTTVKKITVDDKTEDLNRYAKKVLAEKSYFHRRLLKAFPKIDLRGLLSKLKIDIKNKKD